MVKEAIALVCVLLSAFFAFVLHAPLIGILLWTVAASLHFIDEESLEIEQGKDTCVCDDTPAIVKVLGHAGPCSEKKDE